MLKIFCEEQSWDDKKLVLPAFKINNEYKTKKYIDDENIHNSIKTIIQNISEINNFDENDKNKFCSFIVYYKKSYQFSTITEFIDKLFSIDEWKDCIFFLLENKMIKLDDSTLKNENNFEKYIEYSKNDCNKLSTILDSISNMKTYIKYIEKYKENLTNPFDVNAGKEILYNKAFIFEI